MDAKANAEMVVADMAADDRLVQEALLHIGRVYSQALLSTVVLLGEYLIEKFYGGLEEARSRRPSKATALAKLLASASELPVSAHALKQSVRVAVQFRDLPVQLAESLSKTQHEALLPVADQAKKIELAQEAVSRQLTTRQLLQRVNAEAERRPSAGGRPPMAPLARRIGALFRVLDAPGLEEEMLPSAVQALSAEEAGLLRARAERVRDLLDQVCAVLEAGGSVLASGGEGGAG